MRTAKLLGICIVATVLILTLPLVSCKKQTSGEKDDEITVISFSEDSRLFRPIDSFKGITCLQLEMTDESVLGKIKKVVCVEDKIITLTADNEVVVFDRQNGKYVRHIGAAGEGPEEYIDAQDMFYNFPNGTIDIYDRMKDEIVSYKLDGKFTGKKRLPVNLPYVESMEIASDGTLLVCNQIAGGLSRSSDYAFTLISSDGKWENFDPFAPVTVEGGTQVFAERPMSVLGDEMKFAGFLSDTIYCVKNDRIEPLYKLDFDNRMVSKKIAAELGYDTEYIGYCMRENLLQGINALYETDRYLVVSPLLPGQYGTYWIDKDANVGYHVVPGSTVDSDVRRVVAGELVIKLLGNNENELICCFQDIDLYKRLFTEAISENKGAVALPESVVSAIESIDPEGNPFLLIYSN